MKLRIVFAALVVASAVCLFAQSEKVKGKAKDLKKQVETPQTNQVGNATNAPAKPR